MKIYSSIAMAVPKVLLPRTDIDLTRWAVIACDQHTSEPEYWQQVEEFVGPSPSTLNLIYPEVYLKEKNPEVRIARIKQTMQRYLQENIFVEYEGMVYVERSVASGKRSGLLLCLDLEQYDFNPGSKTLIRATEGTILERIPPRVKIRQDAPLELPHIMVLIDDPEDRVIGQLREKAREDGSGLKKLYDFDLMLNSGHVTGWLITDQKIEEGIAQELGRLAEPRFFTSRYQVSAETPVLLYAVGDGNHSLATAKTIWEEQKNLLQGQPGLINSALRYAMVEIVNLHDPALVFEPIHRVLFGLAQSANLTEEIKTFYQGKVRFTPLESIDLLRERLKNLPANVHGFGLIDAQQWLLVEVFTSASTLPVGTVQKFIDDFLLKKKASGVDYVHGQEAVLKLGRQTGNAGFYLPAMDKNQLFKTVILEGVLPRKTFSMGEAWEKRFYLEARRLVE